MRRLVFARDRGVCVKCGLDCHKAERALRDLRFQDHQAWQQSRADYTARGFNDHKSFWEADHIVEVVNGGGECGLDGLQTLCQPCHKAKTKRLAAELKERRRIARMILIQPSLFP